MFTVGQSPPISWANERQQQIQQPWIQEVAGNLASGDLPTKLRKSENGEAKRRQQETAEQREHRWALFQLYG